MAATAQLQTYDRANLQQQAFDSLLSDHYYYYYKNRTRSTQFKKKLANTITQCKKYKKKKEKNTALTIHSLRTIRTYNCRNTHIYIIPI